MLHRLIGTALLLGLAMSYGAEAQQCSVDSVSCSLSCSVGSGSLSCDSSTKSCSASCSSKDGKDLPELVSIFKDVMGPATDSYGYPTGDANSQIEEISDILKSMRDYAQGKYLGGDGTETLNIYRDSNGYARPRIEEYDWPVSLDPYGNGRSLIIMRVPDAALSQLTNIYSDYDLEQQVENAYRNPPGDWTGNYGY